MRIFLMGMPGSGKSTAGKKLARLLSVPFIDLDKFIEDKFKKKVSLIFSEEGENEFRLKEKDCLHEIISSNKNFLLSLGGGTPCFFDNLEHINDNGISVYLEMSAAAIASRIAQGAGERPMFQGKNQEQILAKLNELQNERERFYNNAKITVGGMNLDVEGLADLLRFQYENK